MLWMNLCYVWHFCGVFLNYSAYIFLYVWEGNMGTLAKVSGGPQSGGDDESLDALCGRLNEQKVLTEVKKNLESI